MEQISMVHLELCLKHSQQAVNISCDDLTHSFLLRWLWLTTRDPNDRTLSSHSGIFYFS